MKIEILYSDGCPNWLVAKTELEQVLDEHGIQDPIEFVSVESNDLAQQLRFVGSPSVRINGKDVDPETPTEGFNMECRLYWVDGKLVSSPPREWVERAIERAGAA